MPRFMGQSTNEDRNPHKKKGMKSPFTISHIQRNLFNPCLIFNSMLHREYFEPQSVVYLTGRFWRVVRGLIFLFYCFLLVDFCFSWEWDPRRRTERNNIFDLLWEMRFYFFKLNQSSNFPTTKRDCE